MSLRYSTLLCFLLIQQPSVTGKKRKGVEPKKQVTKFSSITLNDIIVLHPWGGTHFFITREQMLKNSPLHVVTVQLLSCI